MQKQQNFSKYLLFHATKEDIIVNVISGGILGSDETSLTHFLVNLFLYHDDDSERFNLAKFNYLLSNTITDPFFCPAM